MLSIASATHKVVSAIPLPASLFRLLLLLLLLPLDMDIAIARYFIQRTKRLAVKSDVFVVDKREACGGPVAVRLCVGGGGRGGRRGVCVLCLGRHLCGEAEGC